MPNPVNPTVAELTGGVYMETAASILRGKPIPYVMLHGNGTSYSEELLPGTANSGYDVLVDWENANQFVVDVMGSHINNGSTITRWNPEPHAFWPGLYCVGCKLVQSLGVVVTDEDVAGALSYDYAAYHLTFAPLTYQLGVNGGSSPSGGEISRYVTRPPSKLVGESIQVQGIIKYVSDGGIVATPPTIKSSYTEFTLIQEYVPEPITNILAKAQLYQNTINTVPFDTAYDAYSVGTVLYLGLGERERLPFSSTGAVLWRLPHRFLFRPQGWNTALRLSAAAPPAAWEAVVAVSVGGSSWPPYPQSYDFARLFEVATN